MNTNSIVKITASRNLKTIFINKEKTSWIKLVKLNDKHGLTMYEFEQLWSVKLLEKHKIKIMGKEIVCPRYTKSYLKEFSRLINEAI